jgi:hypothetical protein
MTRRLLILFFIGMIFSSTAQAQLKVKNSGGDELMRITSDGDMGMATSTPAGKIMIKGFGTQAYTPSWTPLTNLKNSLTIDMMDNDGANHYSGIFIDGNTPANESDLLTIGLRSFMHDETMVASRVDLSSVTKAPNNHGVTGIHSIVNATYATGDGDAIALWAKAQSWNATKGMAGLFEGPVSVEGPISVVDGTEGAGKVLTSDADGNASWQTPAAGSDNQTLAITNHQLSISGGNTVNLPDNDGQTLSVSGNNLTISNGNTVNLPISSVNVRVAHYAGMTAGNARTISFPTDGLIEGVRNFDEFLYDIKTHRYIEYLVSAGMEDVPDNGGQAWYNSHLMIEYRTSGDNWTKVFERNDDITLGDNYWPRERFGSKWVRVDLNSVPDGALVRLTCGLRGNVNSGATIGLVVGFWSNTGNYRPSTNP